MIQTLPPREPQAYRSPIIQLIAARRSTEARWIWTGMKKASKASNEKMVRALLEKHGRPILFHEVRTRFLGNIAKPQLAAALS